MYRPKDATKRKVQSQPFGLISSSFSKQFKQGSRIYGQEGDAHIFCSWTIENRKKDFICKEVQSNKLLLTVVWII